ncbi:MAG: hypothetical protein H8E36_10780 [Rhodospirillaceae bacterium]|nr:hypothetical protein [Rhodospirillaceae bacterium]MBL6941046.1 hypothetical protein [Rhodospirillales bacterium]
MSAHDSTTDLETINAPWNKTVTVQEVTYEGGMKMLRLRIKEGMRFTDLELDAVTLKHLNGCISGWLALNAEGS